MRNAPRELLELLRRELCWQRVLRELDQAIAAVTKRLAVIRYNSNGTFDNTSGSGGNRRTKFIQCVQTRRCSNAGYIPSVSPMAEVDR